MKICKLQQCSNEIASKDSRTKFCSRRCASIYRNTGVRRHSAANSVLASVCLLCSKHFSYNKHKAFGKYCSNKCKGIHSSQEYKKRWLELDADVLKTISRSTMRNYIIEDFGPHCQMQGCDVTSEWLQKPLTLILDHIDGNAGNNLPNNVRLICPNCNSQTPNFGARNKGKGRKARGLKLY